MRVKSLSGGGTPILENIPSQKVANKVGMSLYKYFEKNNLRQIAQVVNKDN